ncbi:uncharacterized protein L203_106313 [Cryptococcus depauperatus CBS 7841]|uniref:Uncharacterized protein n=1 Tax=Cryptococcus depauperatus CBS 7841 TaxID=1295531 RepID=A0AAJ8M4Z6_9TREE
MIFDELQHIIPLTLILLSKKCYDKVIPKLYHDIVLSKKNASKLFYGMCVNQTVELPYPYGGFDFTTRKSKALYHTMRITFQDIWAAEAMVMAAREYPTHEFGYMCDENAYPLLFPSAQYVILGKDILLSLPDAAKDVNTAEQKRWETNHLLVVDNEQSRRWMRHHGNWYVTAGEFEDLLFRMVEPQVFCFDMMYVDSTKGDSYSGIRVIDSLSLYRPKGRVIIHWFLYDCKDQRPLFGEIVLGTPITIVFHTRLPPDETIIDLEIAMAHHEFSRQSPFEKARNMATAVDRLIKEIINYSDMITNDRTPGEEETRACEIEVCVLNAELVQNIWAGGSRADEDELYSTKEWDKIINSRWTPEQAMMKLIIGDPVNLADLPHFAMSATLHDALVFAARPVPIPKPLEPKPQSPPPVFELTTLKPLHSVHHVIFAFLEDICPTLLLRISKSFHPRILPKLYTRVVLSANNSALFFYGVAHGPESRKAKSLRLVKILVFTDPESMEGIMRQVYRPPTPRGSDPIWHPRPEVTYPLFPNAMHIQISWPILRFFLTPPHDIVSFPDDPREPLEPVQGLSPMMIYAMSFSRMLEDQVPKLERLCVDLESGEGYDGISVQQVFRTLAYRGRTKWMKASVRRSGQRIFDFTLLIRVHLQPQQSPVYLPNKTPAPFIIRFLPSPFPTSGPSAARTTAFAIYNLFRIHTSRDSVPPIFEVVDEEEVRRELSILVEDLGMQRGGKTWTVFWESFKLREKGEEESEWEKPVFD